MAKLTKKTIKHPFFRYRAEVENPRRPGETRIAVRTARTGEEVMLTEYDVLVGEEHGAFYNNKELELLKAGMTHEAIAILSATGKAPEYVDNDAPHADGDAPAEDLGLADGLDPEDDEDDDDDEVVDLDDLEGEELSEAVEAMTIPDLVEAVGEDAELAKRVLEADAQATGGDPRKGLQHELDKVIAASDEDED